MYRSISTNRFSDDQTSYYSSSSPSSKVPTALRALTSQHSGGHELPVYEPLSEAAKKERTRTNFAEKAVHAIPLVLLLCALILWIFSDPDVDLREKVQGIAAKEGTRHLPLHLGHLEDPAMLRDTNTIFPTTHHK